jgi:hypothetical protein
MARWYGMAIGGGMIAALLIANPAIHPLGVLIGLLVLVAIIEGLLRYPAVMLVPVIFIPSFTASKAAWILRWFRWLSCAP